MPYEDHLQKQIDRFALALANLLKSLVSGENEIAVTEPQLTTILQEHAQINLHALMDLDSESLRGWFAKPPFDKENRDLFLRLVFERYRIHPDDQVNSLLINLIRIADSEADAISLERLEMMKKLTA